MVAFECGLALFVEVGQVGVFDAFFFATGGGFTFLGILIEAGWCVVEDGAELVEGMDGLALNEAGVLIFAKLFLNLVHREFGFELEDVVEELDAALGEVVEQIGVGAILVVHDVGEREELLLGVKKGVLDPFEADTPGTDLFFDAERDESGVEEILVKAVVPKRLHEVCEM